MVFRVVFGKKYEHDPGFLMLQRVANSAQLLVGTEIRRNLWIQFGLIDHCQREWADSLIKFAVFFFMTHHKKELHAFPVRLNHKTGEVLYFDLGVSMPYAALERAIGIITVAKIPVNFAVVADRNFCKNTMVSH